MVNGELPDNPTNEDFQRLIEQSFPDPAIQQYLIQKLRSPHLVSQDRLNREALESRLMDRWRQPIDLYDLFLVSARQIGENFNRDNWSRAEADQSFTFLALIRIHARACLIASEIRALMVSGHASGAMARWRLLHELRVVAIFLKSHGNDVALRYMQHEAIQSAKNAKIYQRHHEKLGHEPFDEPELAQLRTKRDDLIAQYGSAYKDDYGWATGVLQGRPTFARLEEAVGLDYWRPYFGMASHSVHAGFKGMVFDIGLMESTRSSNLALAGPSNAGLADPGHTTLIALLDCTRALLSHIPTPKVAFEIEVLTRLCDAAGTAFLDAHNKLQQDEAAYNVQPGAEWN